MVETAGYRQFCPVAMAAEVLCTRWTMLILRELLAGSTRFNELRKGVPRMSPALLSKRLDELEDASVITVTPAPETGGHRYELTDAGRALMPVVTSMGQWGQRWLEAQLSLKNLDPSLLMWDMRRNLDPKPLPAHRVVIQFLYPDAPRGQRRWWLVIERGETDLCSVDPGHDIDLRVSTDVKTMTGIWMGLETVAQAARENRMSLDGETRIAERMQDWLGLSPFASKA